MLELIQSSLIIATYNWPDALELVLKSIQFQSIMPMEVIIADDGSKQDTKAVIDRYKEILPVAVHHIWHEDKGFRLATIRNKAIKSAKANYIIQIDGDTFLHPDFVKDHIQFAKKGVFISGSRVLLGPDLSKKLFQNKSIDFSKFENDITNRHYQFRNTLLSKILFKPQNDIQKVIRTVRGCNMSFWKDDLLAVNGYDERIIGWGREDSEISARLVNLGLKKASLKFSAIQYHLYHPETDKDNLEQNHQTLIETIENKRIIAKEGIEKDFNKIFKKKVTAIIPTYNESKNIEAAIESVQWADEILVIDSYSNDDTVNLAKKSGAKIIQRKFDNFSAQKNYAIEQASNDWIFVLDADERISNDLLDEIKREYYNRNSYNAYWIPRINYFTGKKVRFSAWQNDRVIRFFNRKFAKYNGKLVHEEIATHSEIGQFQSPIIHYTCNDIEKYKAKMQSYARLKAQELYLAGVKPNWYRVFIKPIYRFIYHYIIQFGILDGKTGWQIAKINAFGMRKRYQILKELYAK